MKLIFFLFFFVVANCCENGWQKFEQKCFKYIATKANYKAGLQLCKSLNATMASVHSLEELVFIEDIGKHFSTTSGVHWVWLGGQRIKNKNQTNEIVEFKWQDGTNFNFTKWRLNCPDKRKEEDCILMSIFQSRPSHWCNYKCDTNFDNIICQKPHEESTTNSTETEVTTDLNLSLCEIGWTFFDNNCYKFFEINQTWSVANAMCIKNDANLLSINSESEQMFIQNFLFTINEAKEAVWLGSKRRINGKEFYWIDNSTFNYQNYAPHEPDNRNQREYCLAINNVEEFFGLWLDAPCNVLFSVACKKKATKTINSCSNLQIINEVEKSSQTNNLIINLLQNLNSKVDDLTQERFIDRNKIDAIAMKHKYDKDKIEQTFSLIKLTLNLNIFVSIILVCIFLFSFFILLKRRYFFKKPYSSIFSFKNLSYVEKNLNNNEYEELMYPNNTILNDKI